MHKYKILIPMLAALLSGACDSGQVPDAALTQATVRELPIINGKLVTGNNRLSTVALVLHYYGDSAFCTGTLISPNYVLTAGHCVSNCNGDDSNLEATRPYMRVGVGQSEGKLKTYEIASFHPHPNFYCTESEQYGNTIDNDIAIIKLKKPIPLSEVTPTMVISPNLDMTPAEVDGNPGITTTAAGFGRTSANGSAGVKYETELPVLSYCPETRKKSKYCNYGYGQTHFIYTYSDTTGTCQGDSGGPLFWTKNGIEYVVGITSYGPEGCLTYSAFTMVSDYYDFIKETVDDLGAAMPEDCSNEKDDNDDGRIDCEDPYCFGEKRCIPEDCRNDLDDNDNGLIDCTDPECQDAAACQPEICDNKRDDNENGYVDCNDPECYEAIVCKPEICNNDKDDNGDGKTDCDDAQCEKSLYCLPEVCDNRVDDNGNNLVDCDDPQCEHTADCLPEICDNSVDDNGDKLTDCDDPKCRAADVCQPENCTDGIDNNGDGLKDCEDPQCATVMYCQKEICDDFHDNNGDGLVDCNDPQCAEADICLLLGGSAILNCNTAPASGSTTPLWLLAPVLALGGILRRRRRAS